MYKSSIPVQQQLHCPQLPAGWKVHVEYVKRPTTLNIWQAWSMPNCTGVQAMANARCPAPPDVKRLADSAVSTVGDDTQDATHKM